jgi:hypothetical protein
MAQAAESAEKASGALTRGNTKEATEAAKSAAGMLHELSRQVKGLIPTELPPQLAMARDLAEELAEREEEMGAGPSSNGPPDSQAGEGKGEGKPSPAGKGSGADGDAGRGGPGGRGGLTDAERIERLAEAARTLEDWLKAMERRGEGEAAEQVRQLVQQGTITEVLRRMDRIGEVYIGGPKVEFRKEAQELARLLQVLGQSLDVLHRGIVAPQLAALVGYEKRVAELIAKLQTLKSDAEITEWHRLADALLRDLAKKTGDIKGLAELGDAMHDAGWGRVGGSWDWGPNRLGHWVAPTGYTTALNRVVAGLQDKIQDLILKDLVAARDEATPPEYKELVERYYEVLSKDGGGK